MDCKPCNNKIKPKRNYMHNIEKQNHKKRNIICIVCAMGNTVVADCVVMVVVWWTCMVSYGIDARYSGSPKTFSYYIKISITTLNELEWLLSPHYSYSHASQMRSFVLKPRLYYVCLQFKYSCLDINEIWCFGIWYNNKTQQKKKTAFIHAQKRNTLTRLPNLSHIMYNMKCWRTLLARVSNVNVCRSSQYT